MAGPEVVAAPEIWLDLKDAVIVETEHDEDAAALGLGEDAIELPCVVLAVAKLVLAVPLEPESLVPHPDSDVVDARFLAALEPVVVIVSAPAAMPADAQAVQEERCAIIQAEIAFLFRLDAG